MVKHGASVAKAYLLVLCNCDSLQEMGIETKRGGSGRTVREKRPCQVADGFAIVRLPAETHAKYCSSEVKRGADKNSEVVDEISEVLHTLLSLH